MDFTYKDKIYDNLYVLGKDLYRFDEGFVPFIRNDDAFLAFVASQDAKKAKHLEVQIRQAFPNDILLFRISYLLNPHMSFRFRNKEYASFKTLGTEMILQSPKIDPYFSEILRFSLLTTYLELTGRKDGQQDFFDVLEAIEKKGEKDAESAYFELAYFLSERKTILYEGVEYENLFNLTYYLSKRENPGLDDVRLDQLLPVLKAYGKYGNDKLNATRFIHLLSEQQKAERKLKEALERKEEEIRSLL